MSCYCCGGIWGCSSGKGRVVKYNNYFISFGFTNKHLVYLLDVPNSSTVRLDWFNPDKMTDQQIIDRVKPLLP